MLYYTSMGVARYHMFYLEYANGIFICRQMLIALSKRLCDSSVLESMYMSDIGHFAQN